MDKEMKINCGAKKSEYGTWVVVTEDNRPVDGFYASKKLASAVARWFTRDQEYLRQRLRTTRFYRTKDGVLGITW